jgi:hypothetical protein
VIVLAPTSTSALLQISNLELAIVYMYTRYGEK